MPLLTLPDTRQTTPYGCGEAAVRVVLDYHGIAAVVRFATPQDGSDPRQLEAALRRIGLRVASGEMTVEDLRHFCGRGVPVIALLHWPDGQDSHYVAVRGCSRGRVYYLDPADGPGSCSAAEFVAAWRADGRLGEVFTCWGIAAWPG